MYFLRALEHWNSKFAAIVWETDGIWTFSHGSFAHHCFIFRICVWVHSRKCYVQGYAFKSEWVIGFWLTLVVYTGDKVQYNGPIYCKFIVSIFKICREYTHNILALYIVSIFHIYQQYTHNILGLYMLSISADIPTIYLQYTESTYSSCHTIYGLGILWVYCDQTIQKRKKNTCFAR